MNIEAKSGDYVKVTWLTSDNYGCIGRIAREDPTKPYGGKPKEHRRPVINGKLIGYWIDFGDEANFPGRSPYRFGSYTGLLHKGDAFNS